MRRECLASEDQVAELSKTLQGREHMARAEQSRAEQSPTIDDMPQSLQVSIETCKLCNSMCCISLEGCCECATVCSFMCWMRLMSSKG